MKERVLQKIVDSLSAPIHAFTRRMPLAKPPLGQNAIMGHQMREMFCAREEIVGESSLLNKRIPHRYVT